MTAIPEKKVSAQIESPSEKTAIAVRSQSAENGGAGSVVKGKARRQGAKSPVVGAGTRNRTADLLITNQSLYRLSYSGLRATRRTDGARRIAIFQGR